MRRSLPSLALALSIAGFATHVIADDHKVARGTIASLNADAVTITMRDGDRRFTVDGRTTIEAVGAGTATRRAAGAGKPGPKLSEVLKVGQAVEVSYHDVNGSAYATRIRRVSSAAARSADDNPRMTSNGTVRSFADNALTISGQSGGSATFEQTFIVDAKTKVIGKGFSTAARKTGGRLPANELISSGDTVAVSYDKMGSALHAANIRVVSKAKR